VVLSMCTALFITRLLMRTFLSMGAEKLDEAGPVVFKAIEDDQLYIITHEHYDKYIQARCENMLARRNPEAVEIDHNIKR
ncbi:MAG: hypothetical protein IJI11_06580, partial [Mogibacterium sp.]|nr:hypothetical protein [Mogibacterium sp.]